MSKLRVGIVGLGIMGKAAGNVLKRNPYVEIVAGADLSPAKRKATFDELGIQERYERYEEMLVPFVEGHVQKHRLLIVDGMRSHNERAKRA